jgi:hypothetical protein
MLALAAVTDHLANSYLSQSTGITSGRVHLINDVVQAIKRAQNCRHGYLATGDPSYLDAYRAASLDVDFTMDRLVTEDNEITTKLAHADTLRDFVHARLTEIGQFLASTPPAKPPLGLPDVDPTLARIQRLLDSLAHEESRDMSGQIQAAQARTQFHRDLVIAIAAINILFLGGVAFCAMQIGKLYSLVTMCAWSRRVQYQGKWIPLEEYMSKRFGIRISHGISEEEYDKWAVPEMADVPQDPSIPAPDQKPPPKVAA